MLSRPFCATVARQEEIGRTSKCARKRVETAKGMDCVLKRNSSTTDLAPPGATPTLDGLPRRLADFGTIGEALDYAGQGKRGLNFHDARGSLTRAYSFTELREEALTAARRLVTLGIKPGDRVALVAETGP